MSNNACSLVSDFRDLRVVVIGDAMLDTYLEGTTRRLCREAPVPIVDVARQEYVPGGAANAAVNVRAMGAQVSLVSAIGEDGDGAQLCLALERSDVSTEHLLFCPNRQTLAKSRVLASEQILLRFDQGTTTALDAPSEETLSGWLSELFAAADAIIVSDYGYGVITPQIIGLLGRLQRRHARSLIVDSRRNLQAFRSLRPTAVKPNFDEAASLLGLREAEMRDRPAAELIMESGPRILEATGARIAAVTLDADGAVLLEHGAAPYRTYARPTRHGRAAGAGDTFIAALAMSLAAGGPAPLAAEVASAAAAIVVAKDGTSVCDHDELFEWLSASGKVFTDPQRLSARVDGYRREGLRIVFTNGCFDILHRGHVTYLNRAKGLGDVLIVGVNSDESVSRLKGPGRPINSLDDRIQVLGALSCIDHLVAFDEDTPEELIRAVRPDVFAKGGDYSRETLPEAPLVEQFGGAIQILPLVENRSTTKIIERIQGTEQGNGSAVG